MSTRLSFKTRPQETSWDDLQRMWVEAERIDVLTAGWLFDHLMPTPGTAPNASCFEGWTALAVLAGITDRLRMGLIVTGNTYRHPAVLAKMAATLDVASAGRLEIGMGAGWFQEEHHAYGIDFPSTRERLERLEEACAVLHSLLTNPTTTYAGNYYTLHEAPCEPKPVQRPRPPLILGGQGERRALRTAARWADEWNFPGTDPEILRAKHDVLARHCADLGRDVREVNVSAHVWCDGRPDRETAAQARALVRAGADHIILYLHAPFTPERLRPLAEYTADAIGVT